MTGAATQALESGPATDLTVVVADDHTPTRAMIVAALVEAGITVLGEASDAEEAVALVRSLRPDMALLDVRMPGGGIAAAAEVCAGSPRTVVVMLTVSDDDEDLFAALRVGAIGYVLKGDDPATLPPLLWAASSGEPVLEGALLSRVLREFRAAEHQRLFEHSDRECLSKRERQVLTLLEQEHTTAEIADRLCIAKVTVRSHIAAICHKLRLPDRDAAVRELRRRGRSPADEPEGPSDDSSELAGSVTRSPSSPGTPESGTPAT